MNSYKTLLQKYFSNKKISNGRLNDIPSTGRAVADLEEQNIPMLVDISKKDIHIHLLEGAISKEGPSAGVTIYAAIASLLSGMKARQDIAMT